MEEVWREGAAGPRIAEIQRPAELMMIGEKGGGTAQYIMSRQYYAMRMDHNEGSNIAFIDGHVEWERMNEGNVGYGYRDAHSDPPHTFATFPPHHVFYNYFGSQSW